VTTCGVLVAAMWQRCEASGRNVGFCTEAVRCWSLWGSLLSQRVEVLVAAVCGGEAVVAVGGHVSAWWWHWVGLAVVWGVVVAAWRRSMMVQQPLVMEARVGMEGQQTLVMMARVGMVGQQARVMVAMVWWWRRGCAWWTAGVGDGGEGLHGGTAGVWWWRRGFAWWGASHAVVVGNIVILVAKS